METVPSSMAGSLSSSQARLLFFPCARAEKGLGPPQVTNPEDGERINLMTGALFGSFPFDECAPTG